MRLVAVPIEFRFIGTKEKPDVSPKPGREEPNPDFSREQWFCQNKFAIYDDVREDRQNHIISIKIEIRVAALPE